MPIEFHCEHCGKLVRTAEQNAGRQGRCPYCKNSVYIPTPSEDLEPLKLAPLDPEEERRQRRLEEEARALARRLRAEKETLPPETPRAGAPEPSGEIRFQVDMESLVIEYVRAMYEGRLAEAQEYATDIRRDMERAQEVIQRLTMDDIRPLKIAKIPRPVLIGFLRQLREQG